MLGAGIIIPEKINSKFIHSLQQIGGVEWNGFYSSGEGNGVKLGNALLFSSADFLPLLSELLIVLDPEYCRFDYLSNAIRNGCHLFLAERLNLNYEERKELIRLAKEGDTYIQIKNDFLFQPTHTNIITGKNATCYIELCHSEPLSEGKLRERLINNLSLIQMAAGVPVHRFEVFCAPAPIGPSDIINIHIKFINGTIASVTLTFMEELKTHILKVYSGKGLDIIDLFTSNNNKNTNEDIENDLMIEQLNSFVRSIKEKSGPLFNLTDETEIYLFVKKIKEKININSVY